jgi:hypothetical protein
MADGGEGWGMFHSCLEFWDVKLIFLKRGKLDLWYNPVSLCVRITLWTNWQIFVKLGKGIMQFHYTIFYMARVLKNMQPWYGHFCVILNNTGATWIQYLINCLKTWHFRRTCIRNLRRKHLLLYTKSYVTWPWSEFSIFFLRNCTNEHRSNSNK